MIIGILKENDTENRVVLLPEHIKKLLDKNNEILVEKGAGEKSFAPDSAYIESGGKVVSTEELYSRAEIFLGINAPESNQIKRMPSKKVFIGQINPFSNKETVTQMATQGISSFSLDLIPRTTRAQSMDVLSSMATIAGYKAVLDAASHLPSFFPMFMSAAGTIKPSKVLILGAGVAGLQAIAMCRKLGAVVHVFDVRSAVKEEVLSLGGKFIEVEGAKEDKDAGGYAVEQTEEFKKKQQEMIQDYAKKSNVVISTAQIPGKKAPVLILKDTVENMAAGSVIVDLAASTGGNCELTENNKTINYRGVTIIGESNYPSKMPADASKMMGNNVTNFLTLFFDKENNFHLNMEDDIIKGTCITHNNEIVNERLKTE